MSQQVASYVLVLATLAGLPAAAQTTATPASPAPAAPTSATPTAPTPTAPTPTAPTPAAPAAASAKAPDSLTILFNEGSAAIRPGEEGTLDQASRLFRDGKPVVMLVAGATDSVGSATANLRLSELRANVVVRELVARGIPVDRFQVLGKGETEPAVPAQKGTAEPKNRSVEITWR